MYGVQRRMGVKRIQMKRAVPLISWKSRTGLYSARHLREKYTPMIAIRCVLLILLQDTHLMWQKVPTALKSLPLY